MQNIFHNYEIIKLPVQHPDMTNLLIFVMFICVALFTMRRSAEPFELLGREQTEQIRGIAILCIIIGHLWWHLAENKPYAVFSSEAVSIFFLFSGFGLAMSSKTKKLTLRSFIGRRVRRVMMPYWLVTILILSLDFLLLGRTYPLKDVVLTMLGINLSATTKYIDYVRWFITSLLLWYIVFYIAASKLKCGMMNISLFLCAVFFFFADHYITPFFKYHVFAFPLGCLIACYYDPVRNAAGNHSRFMLFSAAPLFLYVIAHKVWIADYLTINAPHLLIKMITEINGLLFSYCLIVVMMFISQRRYYSVFLKWTGKYSYELFLLHGAFLVRYNPVIADSRPMALAGELLVFIMLVFLLAGVLHKTNRMSKVHVS